MQTENQQTQPQAEKRAEINIHMIRKEFKSQTEEGKKVKKTLEGHIFIDGNSDEVVKILVDIAKHDDRLKQLIEAAYYRLFTPGHMFLNTMDKLFTEQAKS